MDGKDVLAVAVDQIQVHLEAVLEVDSLDGQATERILFSVVIVQTRLLTVGSGKDTPSLFPLLHKQIT